MLIYALGGGLGHATRSLAVSHTLGDRLDGPVTILVSPGHLNLLKSAIPGISFRELPITASADKDLTSHWVREQIEDLQPTQLVIDCFPFGIFGELTSVIGCFKGERILIGRALKTIPRLRDSKEGRTEIFDACFLVEDCPPQQIQRFEELCNKVENLQLCYPPIPLLKVEKDLRIRHTRARPMPTDATDTEILNYLAEHETCLTVHSGPDEEIEQLLKLASEHFPNHQKLLISPNPPEFELPYNVSHQSLYPAWPLFDDAAAVVSACGFNVMAQMRKVETPHRFQPMERRFDDQFRRAAIATNSA